MKHKDQILSITIGENGFISIITRYGHKVSTTNKHNARLLINDIADSIANTDDIFIEIRDVAQKHCEAQETDKGTVYHIRTGENAGKTACGAAPTTFDIGHMDKAVNWKRDDFYMVPCNACIFERDEKLRK